MSDPCLSCLTFLSLEWERNGEKKEKDGGVHFQALCLVPTSSDNLCQGLAGSCLPGWGREIHRAWCARLLMVSGRARVDIDHGLGLSSSLHLSQNLEAPGHSDLSLAFEYF